MPTNAIRCHARTTCEVPGPLLQVDSSVWPDVVYKNEKGKQLLGISNDAAGRGEKGEGEWKYRTKEETTKDLLVDFAERGW